MPRRGKTDNEKTDPLMDNGIRGWMVSYAHRNLWRVASFYQLEDLIQDGYVKFAELRRSYPDITDARHVMGLFKRMYSNHINDLSNQRTPEMTMLNKDKTKTRVRVLELAVSQVLGADQSEERFYENVPLTAMEPELGTIMQKIASAPAELGELMRIFMTDIGQRQINRPCRRDRRGLRESTNEKLCRAISADPKKVDLAAMFKAHFMGVGQMPPPPPTWEGFLLSVCHDVHQVLSSDSMISQTK